jgi:hypothetical protein
MVIAEIHSNLDHSGVVILKVNAHTPLIHLLHLQIYSLSQAFLAGFLIRRNDINFIILLTITKVILILAAQ